MVKVNGQSMENLEGMSIAEFLQTNNYPDKMIAVECNGTIVPRATWAEKRLMAGDTIEVVRFVGGG